MKRYEVETPTGRAIIDAENLSKLEAKMKEMSIIKWLNIRPYVSLLRMERPGERDED